MELRPYQLAAVERTLSLANAGRNVCLVAPTGSGKTVMGLETVRQYNKLAAVLTHRVELADQARAAGIPADVLSWQQVARGDAELEYKLLLIDECHHSGSGGAWQKALGRFPQAVRVGLTATPQRGDGRPLGDVFDELVVAANYSELLAGGYLVPCRVFRPDKELDGLAKHPVDEYLERTPGEQAVVFVSGKEEAERFAQDFRDRGVTAEALYDSMHPHERTRIVEEFKYGTITVLVNVFILTEGFDHPPCSVIVVARGCESSATYLQMCGRGLRPAPGKRYATLLDLRGVSHRLGLPTQDRAYALTGKAIQTTKPLRLCPACGWTYEPVDKCPNCGYKATGAERRQQILNERTDLASGKLPADLDELERLLKLARDKGWQPRWAVGAYLKTHERPEKWPPGLYNEILIGLRKEGMNRDQAHAVTRRTLL